MFAYCTLLEGHQKVPLQRETENRLTSVHQYIHAFQVLPSIFFVAGWLIFFFFSRLF